MKIAISCDPIGLPKKTKTALPHTSSNQHHHKKELGEDEHREAKQDISEAALRDRRGWWMTNESAGEDHKRAYSGYEPGSFESGPRNVDSTLLTVNADTSFENKSFFEDKMFAVSGQHLFGHQRAQEAYRSLQPASDAQHFRQPRFTSTAPLPDNKRARPKLPHDSRLFEPDGAASEEASFQKEAQGKMVGNAMKAEWEEWERERGPQLILSDWDPRAGAQMEGAWLI